MPPAENTVRAIAAVACAYFEKMRRGGECAVSTRWVGWFLKCQWIIFYYAVCANYFDFIL
jgi:hypothetical protein